MNGGDQVVIESLSFVISKQNSELTQLKSENSRLAEENIQLKSLLNNQQLIRQVVKETISALPKKTPNFVKKFNKKRKSIIIHRIQNLAEQKNLSLSDIRDIIIEQEQLCSRATFYRYIEDLKKKSIDIMKINDSEIVTII